MPDLSSVVQLHRWEIRGESAVEVRVDHRSALTDALLDHDVNIGEVLDEFDRLVADPLYGDDR